MASIRCPLNVTSITFTTSGAKTPDAAGIVTGLTAAEATAFSAYSNQNGTRRGVVKLQSTDASGNCNLLFPTVISGLTIAGVAYTLTGAVTPMGTALNAAVPAVPASQVLFQNFGLVQG